MREKREKTRYVAWGVAVFCTVAAIMVFYDTLFGSRFLLRFWRELLDAMMPVLYGAFMAYLLAPIVNFFEKGQGAKPVPEERVKKKKTAPFFIVRAISILLTWALIAVLLYLLGSVLLPELYKSVQQLIVDAEGYYRTVLGWTDRLLDTYPGMEAWAVEWLDQVYQNAVVWMKTEALAQAQGLMAALTGGVISVVNFFSDLLVGVMASVYFLATKERCAAHIRKLTYSVFSAEKVYWIMRGSRKADHIFAGFVRGKLLDSLIIGILCFIGCSLLKFPYTPLISVVVGVTNVIPFFGPFVGAIPSIILILLVSPIQALYFAIFILALQQLDGNVIGPAILGDKTGLSCLWVIFAILVGGHFFGFAGMFFGVPVCACLFSLTTFLVERRLKNKQLPAETSAYATEVEVTPSEQPETQEKT